MIVALQYPQVLDSSLPREGAGLSLLLPSPQQESQVAGMLGHHFVLILACRKDLVEHLLGFRCGKEGMDSRRHR
jgi:hypothetical protein